MEENNRMGKTRDVFKKIGDIKKTFHARMGMIKDRKSKDLTEAEEIKKRWQEYTELYKKDLNDPDNLDGVITHLEPDILKCEVKGVLGSITLNKASGSDGIPAELFQVLKDDAIQILKCWTQYARKFGKLRMATGLENVSFHSNLKEGNTKECLNYHTIVLISHASKFMLKILQARLHQYMNWELADVQVGLKKAEESQIKLPTFIGSWKKQGNSKKASISALLTMLKPLTVCITTNCGKFLKRWEYQTTLPVSWEICMQFKKQQLEPDMEQWTGSKLEKECDKAVYCHPAYYMQSTSWEMPGWMNHKLESQLKVEISTTSYAVIPLQWQKTKRN